MSSNDTYPSLDSRYALDPEQIERFRADGHVYLPGETIWLQANNPKGSTRQGPITQIRQLNPISQ